MKALIKMGGSVDGQVLKDALRAMPRDHDDYEGLKQLVRIISKEFNNRRSVYIKADEFETIELYAEEYNKPF